MIPQIVDPLLTSGGSCPWPSRWWMAWRPGSPSERNSCSATRKVF